MPSQFDELLARIPVVPGVEVQLPATAFEKCKNFLKGLFFIAGPIGIIYGTVMLAKLINAHIQSDRKDDLSVGNPACTSDSLIVGAIACAERMCTKLPTLASAQDWVNQHPIDLAGIKPAEIFEACQSFIKKCADNSGFTQTINPGKDSVFVLMCSHTLTTVEEVFSWVGYALFCMVVLVASMMMFKTAHGVLSTLFKPPSDSNEAVPIIGTVVPTTTN